MLKYSPTTDDGRSRVGYFYILILDYKNDPPHSSLVRYPLIYIVICKYFKINIQIEIKQTYCSHYSQVLYKFSLSTSTIFINDKNVVIKFSAQKIKKLQSQIIFILVLGAMKRKDLNRKPKSAMVILVLSIA